MVSLIDQLLEIARKGGKGIEFLTNVNPEQELRQSLNQLGLTDEVIENPSPDAELVDRFIVGSGATKIVRGITKVGVPATRAAQEAASKTVTKKGVRFTEANIVDDAYKTVVKTTKGAVRRIPTNPKTLSLSTKILIGAGFTTAAAGFLVPVIGTYPFAGFIKEETLQTLDFAVKAARDSGDLTGEAEALAFKNEVLDVTAWEKVVSLIPFANVQAQLKDNIIAANVKTRIDEESFNKRLAEEIDAGRRQAAAEASLARQEESVEAQEGGSAAGIAEAKLGVKFADDTDEFSSQLGSLNRAEARQARMKADKARAAAGARAKAQALARKKDSASPGAEQIIPREKTKQKRRTNISGLL